jgi:hypothetical protein
MADRQNSSDGIAELPDGATIERIRQILITQAKRRHLISYSDLAARLKPRLAPNSPQLSGWLTIISRSEYASGRGLLSAVVVRKRGKSLGIPGRGFFTNLASMLSCRQGEIQPKCWRRAVDKVFKYWGARRDR